MLSDFQQNVVWESWLSAEIRAAYFAELVQRFQTFQRILVVSGLILSSGATLALVTSVIPAQWSWIKPLLTLLAAMLSGWSLVAKYERNSIDCADLHSRWNTLSVQYETLWADMSFDGATAKLNQLRTEEIAVSKSSTSQPADTKLLARVQENIVMHHQSQVAMQAQP